MAHRMCIQLPRPPKENEIFIQMLFGLLNLYCFYWAHQRFSHSILVFFLCTMHKKKDFLFFNEKCVKQRRNINRYSSFSATRNTKTILFSTIRDKCVFSFFIEPRNLYLHNYPKIPAVSINFLTLQRCSAVFVPQPK